MAGHPQLYLLGPPRPGSPAPRPPGTGSAGSSGVGMTAAPPAGAAAVARRSGRKRRRKGGEGGGAAIAETPAPRALGEDTARRPALFLWSLPFAARSGGARAGGLAHAQSPAPPTSGTHPPGGTGAAGGSAEWAKGAPPAWGGGRLLQGRPSVPSLERWGGPRAGELAPRAVPGLGRRWVLGERGARKGGPRGGRGARMAPRGELGRRVPALPVPSTAGRKWQRGASWAAAPRASLPPLRRPNLCCPPPGSARPFPRVVRSRSGVPSDLTPGVCAGGGRVALARSQAP